jgi:hypothetical protein
MTVPVFNGVPNGLGHKRALIIGVALQKQGIVEKPLGSNRGPEVERLIPAWAIPDDPKARGPAWCCFAAFKIAHEATGAFPLGRWHGSCTKAWKAAQKAGVAVRNDGTRVPYPGDAFLIGEGDDMRHIGIVYRVAVDGSAINTLEGNCGQRFRCGTRSLVDGQIAGWIDFVPSERPDGFERGLNGAPVTGAQATR